MTRKYKRNCWSCGSSHLKPDSMGVICLDCGATWNGLVTPDALEGLGPELVLRTASGEKVTSSASPSTRAIRNATRARGELPPKRRPERAAR